MTSKQKSQKKGAGSDDPYVTAAVRAILDPEQADVVKDKLAEIRSTGASVSIAAAVEGSIERIVSVGGNPETVGKGCEAILRALHGLSVITGDVKMEEETDADEAKGRQTPFSLRLILPAIFATPLTRPTYPLVSQIQHETSCTLALNASVLPLSTESLLVIQGPLLGVTTAVQKISEYLHTSYEHYAAIQNGAKPPVVSYVPLPVYGTLGSPESYDLPRMIQARMMTPQNPYGMDPKIPLGQPVAAAAVAQVPQQVVGPQAGQVYQQAPTQSVQGPTVGAPQGIQPAVVGPGGQMTQQIFIPNDMVGAIIGKAGAKINEIRQMSGSHIKINEPADNSNERLVTITGTQECNQMALYLLYQRLETEKHRV